MHPGERVVLVDERGPHAPAGPTGRVTDPNERLLRRVALNDEGAVGELLAGDPVRARALDRRLRTLVELGALIALGAPTTSYRCAIENAYAAGATEEDVIGVLSAVAPAAGLARVVAAAPGLALALGYDVEDDLT
jgi:alkylhydroperoxidase/carboxymuconolactone decarboxylase family protein YurZ